MLKRPAFALLLCLPLCALGAGASMSHSSSANDTSAQVTTWRGERALKIPVQLSVTDWSRAGFPASNTAETQTAWLYLTETAFQLQDGAGHTLMGGPRSDIGLETSQCIRMRSLTVNVCANSPFPETKEARETLRGSQTEFSWLYYHLAQAGKNAPTAPNGTMMLAGNNALPGAGASTVAMPVLECRLVNADGSTAIAFGGPATTPVAPNVAAAATPEPLIMESAVEPEAAQPASDASSQPAAVDKTSTTPAKTDVTVHVAVTPAQPAVEIDHAQQLRAMAASSQIDLMEPAGKQPEAMLESHSGSVASVPQPQLPIYVEEHNVAAAPRAATHATITVTAATAAPAPAVAAEPEPEDTSDFASDDLTPPGAPRGVIPEPRVKTVAAAKPVATRVAPVSPVKPVDSHAALLQAEKDARAARVAEMELKHAQDLKAIPSSSESKSVPIDKPRSVYANHMTTTTAFSKPAYVGPATPAVRTVAGGPASTVFSKPAYVEPVAPVTNHVTTSTVFSKPAYAEPGTPAIRTLAGTPVASASFAEIAAPAQPPAQRPAPAPIQEMAQAADSQPVHKKRQIERPAFKPAVLPTVVDTEQ